MAVEGQPHGHDVAGRDDVLGHEPQVRDRRDVALEHAPVARQAQRPVVVPHVVRDVVPELVPPARVQAVEVGGVRRRQVHGPS
nr:hypothetical protein [Pseudokineococcus lusitanus]